MATAAAAATATTTTTTLTKYIKDVTICPLCLDNFTDPRSLPCVHTFCLKCLDGLCSSGVSVQQRGRPSGLTLPCPMCRTPFQVPESGADGLPRNFFVENLLMAKQIADRRRTLCEVCASSLHDDDATTGTNSPGVSTAVPAADVAESFCIECRLKLCARCSRSHAAIRPRPHHVTRIGAAVSWELLRSRSDYCSKHVDYPLAMYCADCDEPACLMCLFARHQSHCCVELDAAAASRFEAQTRADADVIEHLLLEAERHHAAVDEFVSAAERADAEIAARRELLVRLVDEDAERMRNELRRVRGDVERSMTLAERRRRLGEAIREMGTFAAYLKELSGKGSPLDVIRSASQCHLRAAQVKDSMRNAGLDGVCGLPVVEFVTLDLDAVQLFGRLKVTVPDKIQTDSQPVTSPGQQEGGAGHSTVTSHSRVATAATANIARITAQKQDKSPPVKPVRRKQQTLNAESTHNNDNNNNNNIDDHHLQTSSTTATVRNSRNTVAHATADRVNATGGTAQESSRVSTSVNQRNEQRIETRLHRPSLSTTTQAAADCRSNTGQQNLLTFTADSTHYRRHNARENVQPHPAPPIPPRRPAAAAAADGVRQRNNSVEELQTSQQQPQLYRVTLSLSSDRYAGCYDDDILFDSCDDELDDDVWRPYDHEAVESWLVSSGSAADFYHVGGVHPASLNPRQYSTNHINGRRVLSGSNNYNNNIYRRKQCQRHPDNFHHHSSNYFPPGKGHVVPDQRRWTARVQSIRAYSADRLNNNSRPIYNNINNAVQMTSNVVLESRRNSRLERRPAILRQDRSARQPRRREVAVPPSTADPGGSSSWRRGRGRTGEGESGVRGGEERASERRRHRVGRNVDSFSLPGDVDGWTTNYGARLEDGGGTFVPLPC